MTDRRLSCEVIARSCVDQSQGCLLLMKLFLIRWTMILFFKKGWNTTCLRSKVRTKTPRFRWPPVSWGSHPRTLLQDYKPWLHWKWRNHCSSRVWCWEAQRCTPFTCHICTIPVYLCTAPPQPGLAVLLFVSCFLNCPSPATERDVAGGGTAAASGSASAEGQWRLVLGGAWHQVISPTKKKAQKRWRFFKFLNSCPRAVRYLWRARPVMCMFLCLAHQILCRCPLLFTSDPASGN